MSSPQKFEPTPLSNFLNDMVELGGLGSAGSLADAVGCSRAVLKLWRKGSKPSIPNQQRIAEIFKLTETQCEALGMIAVEAVPPTTQELRQKLAQNLIARTQTGPELNDHETALLRDVLEIPPTVNSR